MTEPRILLYDIETTPNLGWIWGKWQQNVLAFDQEWFILSAAWKWLGEKKVQSVALPDFEGYEQDRFDDLGVVQTLWELFNEADIVVAHNGNQFDQPKARTRMVIHDLPPCEPFAEIDTLQMAKRNFKFTSNRLGDLAEVLGLAKKGHPGDIQTWLGCIMGEPKAWERMVRYNKQDVTVLEDVYLRLRPWAKQHPNLALYADAPAACPRCGAEGRGTFISGGWKTNAVTKRRRFQCKTCHGWCSGRALKISDVQHVVA